MDFLTINPELDTPSNFIIALFLFGLLLWSAFYPSILDKKIKDDK